MEKKTTSGYGSFFVHRSRENISYPGKGNIGNSFELCLHHQFTRAHKIFTKHLKKSCHALKFSLKGLKFVTSEVHRKSLKKVRYKFQNKKFHCSHFL